MDEIQDQQLPEDVTKSWSPYIRPCLMLPLYSPYRLFCASNENCRFFKSGCGGAVSFGRLRGGIDLIQVKILFAGTPLLPFQRTNL